MQRLAKLTPPEARPGRAFPCLALWLTLVALLLICHTKFLFFDPHVESGDFAANGLQILNAKQIDELYGNYSRWGFHHPGPAFFYVYAAGEWIFRDVLRLVPSPFNAHILSGIILQTAFFVWALCIVRKRVPHPLVVPLLLAVAALHFATVNFYVQDSVLGSNWPPYVLLFPFVGFIVACTSVASGEIRDLVPAVVAGSFLVHGHVAQPLFVLPCFTIALVALFRGPGRAPSSIRATLKRHRRMLVLCGAIIALAALPLIIDASQGERSNLKMILDHLANHSSDHKSLTASAVYLATFFCYVARPEIICDQITRDSLVFLSSRWLFVALWAGVITTLVILARSACRGSRFVAWLYFYAALCVVLTLCWGVIQNGEMFAFNAHFNHAITYLLLVLLVVAASRSITTQISRGTIMATTLSGVLLFAFVARGFNLRSDFPSIAFPPRLANGLEEAVGSDVKTTKFLNFSHPSWPDAIGVALGLRRLGADYAVSPEWTFMFGRDHGRSLLGALDSPRFSFWKVGRRRAGAAGFELLTGGFVMTARPTLNPAAAEIDFCGPEDAWSPYALAGWIASRDGCAQLIDTSGVLAFRPQPAAQDVTLAISLNADVVPANSESRNLTITFSGTEVARIALGIDNEISVVISRELWNRNASASVVFQRLISLPATGARGSLPPLEPIRFQKILFQYARP